MKIFLAFYLLLFFLVNFSLSCLADSFSQPYRLSEQYVTGDKVQNIRLLGSLKLSGRDQQSDSIGGLSALAWDDDEQLLYAVSDRGYIVHLSLSFDQEILSSVKFLAKYNLLDAKGHRLASNNRDSEGLVLRHHNDSIRGNTELVISFEGEQRICLYNNKGIFLRCITLPRMLAKTERYQNNNKSLEAIIELAGRGLFAAPELPMAGWSEQRITITNMQGNYYAYDLLEHAGSALVALELLDDSHMLSMERAYYRPWLPLIISLRRVQLPSPKYQELKPMKICEVASWDNSQGWFIDNFEGLARYKKDHYLIVSDDNFNVFQNTLLVYFQLINQDSCSSSDQVSMEIVD